MDKRTDSEVGNDGTQEPESELRSLTKEEARDLDRSRRGEETKRILVDADRRDDEATARDAQSEEREHLADRKAFLNPSGDYLGHGERLAAALDRAHSKSDRESSAEDRAHLTVARTDEKTIVMSGLPSEERQPPFDAESPTES